MNYDEQIQNIILDIKADKAIIQPWRNKATSRIEEAQAFIRMGKSTTNIHPPVEQVVTVCTCYPGAKPNVNCPTHGIA